jgi:hypothetical protein
MVLQLDMVCGVYVFLGIIPAIVGFLRVEVIVNISSLVSMNLEVKKLALDSLYSHISFQCFQAGINAWQALEIIFLFLTTATVIVSAASIVCYRIRHSLHYYLAILAVFCAWPAGKRNGFFDD